MKHIQHDVVDESRNSTLIRFTDNLPAPVRDKKAIWKPLSQRLYFIGFGVIASIIIDIFNLTDVWSFFQYVPGIFMIVAILGATQEYSDLRDKDTERMQEEYRAFFQKHLVEKVRDYVESFGYSGAPAKKLYLGGNYLSNNEIIYMLEAAHENFKTVNKKRPTHSANSTGFRIYQIEGVEEKSVSTNNFFIVKLEFVDLHTLKVETWIKTVND